MTRYILHILLYFLFFNSGMTQDDTGLFPGNGDTLSVIRTQLKSIPGENFYGSNNTWNFLFLDAPFVEELVFLKPNLGSAGDFFKDSHLLLLGSNGEEIYYKISNDAVIEKGRFGPTDWFLGDKYLIQYTTAPIIKKNNQKLNNRFRDYSSYYLDIPLTKLSEFGIEVSAISTDKVRFQFDIDKTITYDAEGDLLLPFGNYKVLRSREEIVITCTMLIPSEFGWRELPEDNYYVTNKQNLKIGTFRRTNFRFWTPEHSFPILTIDQLEDNKYNVLYMNDDVEVNLPRYNAGVKDVLAFPNPTFGEITFQLMNYPSGNYTLKVYDIVNSPLYSEQFYVRDNGKINTNLGFLNKGTYLYSIIDKFGKKITTKRVVILRP